MYADRYTRRGLDPAGMAFALGASGFLLFGLSLSAPNLVRIIDKPFVGTNIPLPKDPPPIDKPKPQPHTEIKQATIPQRDPIDTTHPIVPVAAGAATDVHIDLPPPNTTTVGTGTEIAPIIAPVHLPVLRDPTLDGHYSDYFQPNYPSDERLAGHEGRVIVRVLIGTDGRVKDVQQVSAASTSFFEATRKQALAKWRFKPGTKDGVAVEAWNTVAVRFVLNEE